MSRFIVKLRDHYMEWSTIADAPTTKLMPLDRFLKWYRCTYGESGMAELPERMARVEATGTSVYRETAESVITGNRAGPDETELTMDEIYEQNIYVPRKAKERDA
ncbi:MAG: hypothetical protein WC565_07920 [Parcubacteria group bacterium]